MTNGGGTGRWWTDSSLRTGALALLGATLLALAVGLIDFSGTTTELAVDNSIQLIFPLVAAILANLVRRRSSGALRVSWTALTLGCALWAVSQVQWMWLELGTEVDLTQPHLFDIGFLAFPAAAAVALWVYPARVTRNARIRRTLDGIAMIGALVAVSWTAILEPIAFTPRQSGVAVAVSLAYPIADLVVIGVALLTLSSASRHRPVLILLGMAMVAMTVSDLSFTYETVSQTSYRTGGLLDIGWPLTFTLIGLAALLARRPIDVREESPPPADVQTRRVPALSVLPYLPLLAAMITMLVRYRDGRVADGVELIALGVSILAVLARQYLTLIDNRRLLRQVAASRQQLQRQAFQDQLTGLANRALFNDRVAHALELHRRDLRPLALMFCDLDDFKAVNDTHGHAAGDELLVRVAERLRGALRAGDTLARLGGDEFAVLIEDGGEAVAAGSRLIEALRSPFTIHGSKVPVRASVGLIEISSDDPTPPLDALLTRADVAMYFAKRSGKGQLALYDSTMVLPETADLQLSAPLADAIESGDLTVAYQPIVTLDDGKCVALEALARWEHEGTAMSPGDFIPLAVRTGLGNALTEAVLRKACTDLQTWDVDDSIRVAVNVPAAMITDREFPDLVARVLQETGTDPNRLELEITEDALLTDTAVATAVADRLRRTGVRVSLDDFGTGQSSILHLRQIPLDGLKIDIALIADIDGEPGSERFLRALITLGADLGMSITAEGVEREGQASVLRRLGCRQAQGYLYSPPLPAAAVGEIIGTRLPLG